MARAAKAATTDVRIAPYRSVVIDGRAREAGEVVAVPTQDAQTLIGDGYAVPASDPLPESPKTRSKRTRAPRRPITPASLINAAEGGEDTENRGG